MTELTIASATQVATIDLSAGTLHTVLVDGQPHIVLKPAVEALGLDYSAQLKKLKTRTWGTVVETAMVAEDGKVRDMAAAPVRTFLMLLANVNENRVSDSVRPTLIAFQNETADAIEAYWTRGGAINPRATGDDLDMLQGLLDAMRADRRRLAALEQQHAATAAKVAAIEGRHEEFTALGYARLHGHPSGRPYLAQVGKRATALMREQGTEPHRRQDATFGAVNVYPTTVLERAFAEVAR
jgi:hypothetical protein